MRYCEYPHVSSMPSLSPVHPFLCTAPAPPETYTLSRHDALPICGRRRRWQRRSPRSRQGARPRSLRESARRCETGSLTRPPRSEEHTSELQSPMDLVCRILLEKKEKKNKSHLNNKTNLCTHTPYH